MEPILKTGLSSDRRLQLAYVKSELLVNAGQLYCVEYVPGEETVGDVRNVEDGT